MDVKGLHIPVYGHLKMTMAVLLLSVSVLASGLSVSSLVQADGSEGAVMGRGDVRDESLTWLILVYMAGDNDLGRDGYKWGNALKMDLEEMESSFPGPGNKVLALTDQEGDGNSALYDIVHDEGPGINSSTIPLSLLDPNYTDELNMADHNTLTRFLVYSMSTYSAQRTALIVWDHGSGWYMRAGEYGPGTSRGFALDTTSNHAQMYLDDLRMALVNADRELGGLKMDLIAFDTCFMGMVEVFYQVSRWFDIGVGSPDEEPFYGYNYTFISALAEPLTPEQLGSEMVISFKNEYAATTYSYPAIGVVDLNVLKGPFRDRLDHLASELIERMYYLENVRGGIFNGVVSRTESVGSENLDLGDMLRLLSTSDLGPNVTGAASSCNELYPWLVIDKWTKADGRNPQGTGLCIYFPYKTLFYKSIYDGSSGFLDLTMDTRWDELIREYQRPVERVRLELEAEALDLDGLKDDLTVRALDPQANLGPIVGASVFFDGNFIGRTDPLGQFVTKDLSSGTYLIEVYNGTHVGIGNIRMMNRVPVPKVWPEDLSTIEGVPLTLDASSSFDPDGDTLQFRWDLNASDGLDDTDSNDVTVTFPASLEGIYLIRLSVSDGLEWASLTLNITVENAPPVARVSAPSEVWEDEAFNLSGEGSYDHPSDIPTMMYRFFVNGVIYKDWGSVAQVTLSLPLSGYYSLSVEVKDDSEALSSDSTVVRVRNMVPVPVITGPSTAFEDEQLSFMATGSIDTASDLESLLFTWRSNDEPNYGPEGPFFNVSFASSGDHAIWLKVTDDDGASSVVNLTVHIMNRQPVAGITLPLTVMEDEPFELNASSTWDTPSDRPGLNFSWDIYDDGTWDLFGERVITSLSVHGEITVVLRVTDDNGAVSQAYGTVKVLNVAPSPRFVIPATILEDEPLTIEIIFPWDTLSDNMTLQCSWWVDGRKVGSDRAPPWTVFTTEGEHTVLVEAIDDQGEFGRFEGKVLVVNPPPIARLMGVGTRIKEGGRLKLSGAASTDTPSDMENLSYQWFVDGRLQPVSGPDVTLGPFKEGTRLIGLKVTDDEGAWDMDNVTLRVDGRFGPKDILVRALSPLGMIIVLTVIASLTLISVILTKRVRDLRPPEDMTPEDEDAPAEEVQAEGGSGPPSLDLPSDDVKGPVMTSVRPDEGAEKGPVIPPLDVPPVPPEAFGMEVPPPPDIEGLELPDMNFEGTVPNDIGSNDDT